jgi:pyridoxamine 5'-phosphate oxidase
LTRRRTAVPLPDAALRRTANDRAAPSDRVIEQDGGVHERQQRRQQGNGADSGADSGAGAGAARDGMRAGRTGREAVSSGRGSGPVRGGGTAGEGLRVEAVDPAAMRRQYRAAGLDEDDLAPDPYAQFARWFADAVRATGAGLLTEPNAMVVSTAGADGVPSSRTVLLKGYDQRGFVFFTNYRSRKGRELAANPRVSLLFPWHPIARQVIVCGEADRIAAGETETYFHSRPHGSQLGAHASPQSAVVGTRAELERRYDEAAARWPEGTPVPVPDEWGGFRVRPRTVEFWQGRENRLHDRLRYTAAAGGGWRVERLAP